MNDFFTIVAVIDGIIVVCGALALLIKPFRTWFLKDKDQREGIKCLLRGQMLETYYHNKDSGTIRQYEYENFLACYKAYKKMGGNSFIDHIKEEVDKWKIIT